MRQLLVREQTVSVEIARGEYRAKLEDGTLVKIAERAPHLRAGQLGLVLSRGKLTEALASRDLRTGRWVGTLVARHPQETLESLRDAFAFRKADLARNVDGLRAPQLGGLHAVLGYWATHAEEAATVVMPTGTGKTDTMLAIYCESRLPRLLVIVPSDALRDQIANKFETLGVLQAFKVVARSASRPVVGQVRHAFSSAQAAEQFTRRVNVIVTTPPALYASAPAIRDVILKECSHLFIDEAHHVPATTWRQIRDESPGKAAVQFTATPFREDGRHLGGRQIFAYPLGEAQREGYFSTINFVSILDFGDHDRAIATRAVWQLRADIAASRDHLIMARVNRIGRAGDVLPIYQELAPDLNPVILHSSETARARVEALESIRSRRSRIIVCVDMLGEGFDLPSLKIAAIHDPHKSLGVTLQFVGRFARVSDEAVGDATVVVGRPSGEVDQRLRRLYAEDSDWNKVIRDLSQGAVQVQTDISEFEAGFGSLPDEVSMRSLLPKMSTVGYRTAASDWDPDGVLVVFPENRLLTVPIAINQGEHVAWFVTETRVPVRWGELATVEEVSYDLYVVYWNAAMGLLYINSSNSDSLHEDLAKAICGETSSRITGENVYRVMADLDRLVPTNVGVLDIRNRSRRFSLHVGADVSEGFPVAEAQTKTKTNIFAYGYEKGARVSMGASLKGRVWSYRVAETLKQWVDWCDHVGSKLVDDGLSVDEIMRHFIRPKVLEERPPLAPLALEWPWELLQSTTEEVRVQHNGSSWPLIDTELLLDSQGRAGPIEFRVATPDWELPYEMRFEEGAMRFAPRAEEVSIGSRRQGSLLSEFLNGTGLFVHLEQDALVVPPGILLKPERDLAPFDTGRLQVLDWSGITLTVESQGPNRRPDSIQARMLSHVLSLADWDVVLDDDGSGELADIVALRSDGQALSVHLTHCKYVSGGEPRAQVEDLYVVCGQAQKSARWRRNIPLMLQHLIRREKNRVARRHVSGIMKGNAQTLYSMQDNAAFLRPQFTIAVAQPGASVRQITQVQLELLASSEVYVHETARSNFEVYCSA